MKKCPAKTPLGLQLNEKDLVVGFVILAPDFDTAAAKFDTWEKKWTVWVQEYNQWVCGGKKSKFAALRAV